MLPPAAFSYHDQDSTLAVCNFLLMIQHSFGPITIVDTTTWAVGDACSGVGSHKGSFRGDFVKLFSKNKQSHRDICSRFCKFRLAPKGAIGGK